MKKLFNGQILIAKDFVLNKDTLVEVIDADYNTEENMVEVKAIDGAFKGQRFVTKLKYLELVKASAKLTRQGRQEGDYVSYNVEVTTSDIQVSEIIFNKIEAAMSEEMEYLEYTGCPWEDGSTYGDSFSVEYIYGTMGDTDREVKKTWKEVKKTLGLR